MTAHGRATAAKGAGNPNAPIVAPITESFHRLRHRRSVSHAAPGSGPLPPLGRQRHISLVLQYEPIRGHVPQDHRDPDRRARIPCPASTSPRRKSSAQELEHIFTEAVALRRARGPHPQPGRLFRAGDRQGERDRAARPGGRTTGRITTSAATGAPGSARSTPAASPRRSSAPTTPGPTALDGRLIGAPSTAEIEGFDKADWPLHPVRAGDLGGVPLHQPRRRARAVRPGLRAAARPVQPVQPAQPAGARAPIEYDVNGQLEAALPELLRVLPLRPGASRAGQAHPAHQRRERPDRGPVLGGFMVLNRGRGEHDDERPDTAASRWAICRRRT